MTASELVDLSRRSAAILLPVASVETLGRHGPLGLDLTVAQMATPRIARNVCCPYAPPIPFGDTLDFAEMDGTVHIATHTLEDFYYCTARSLLRTSGFRCIVFLTFHSPNGTAAAAACRRLKAEGWECALANWWQTLGANENGILSCGREGTGHGGEMITSVALAVDASSTHMERACNEKPKKKLGNVLRWSGTPFQTFGTFREYCESGTWGDTSSASAEKGEELMTIGVERISEFIRQAFEDA
jgi:creatinine amidohydrolase